MFLGGITPRKAEFLGALTGDRGAFKKTHSSGFYRGYDMSKWVRYVTKICVGVDKDWGVHLSNLIFQEYGVRGSLYWDRNEWRLESSSSRLHRDLANYFKQEWNARSWRVSPALFSAPIGVRRAFIRGYFDADGYPYFSKARHHVYVQVNSVNLNGVMDTKRLLESVGFHPGLYRRYKARDVWELTIHRKSEVFRYSTEIKFSIARKQAKLLKMLHDRWPDGWGQK